MNEQIQKLLKESTYDVLGVKQVDQKKFARLIIEECINNIEVWEKDGCNHISYMLKEHFGIE